MDTLVCTVCHLEKPVTAFHRNHKSKRGYQWRCKDCKAAYQRAHADAHLASSRASYARHREKEHARSAAYHRAHPEKALARGRKYAQTHRILLNQRQKIRYWGNREKASLIRRAYYARNRARSIALVRQWVKSHRTIVYARNHARRILTRYGINGGPVDLDLLYKRDKGICQLCHKHVPRNKASRDHIVPLSKGGEHSYKNCVLAHLSCNASKGNRTVAQQQRLF